MEHDVEKTFCKNFKVWVEKNYPRQEKILAEILQISTQQLNNIKHGRRVGTESWRRWAAEQLGLDYNEMVGLPSSPSGDGSARGNVVVVSGPQQEGDANYKRLPLHDAEDLIGGMDGFTFNRKKKTASALIIPPSELGAKAGHDLRVIRVGDDSMWPRIPEGAFICVDLDDKRFIDGKTYVVREPFSQPPRATIKVVRKIGQKHFSGFALISENQRYLPEMMDVDWEEIVVGRAVWIWRGVEGPQAEAQYQQVRRMDSIDWLAGGIAHDLNNMLSPILGYGEMILAGAGDNDELKEQINHVIGSGKRAQALARQLLAFTRKKIQEFGPVDINALLRNLEYLLLRAIIIKDEITLHMSLTSPLPKINGDSEQIEQVVVNLVNNAQEAMSQGGELTIETSSAELTEEYAQFHGGVQPGHYVLIMVSDTGRGMSEETIDRIFEPFFTTKRKDSSAGLGLSTAYGIIKQHGGNIWAYSEPGIGSTFKIYLPVAPEAPPQPWNSAAPEVSGPDVEIESTIILLGEKGTTILLVENDQMVRDMCSSILRKRGFQVLEAKSGKEAISIAKQYSGIIHLLFTDVILPDTNGSELAEQLIDKRPHLPVLYMSGYAKTVITYHDILDENVNFIQKPFSINDLITKVEDVLNRAKMIP